jgi:hypothetical protein
VFDTLQPRRFALEHTMNRDGGREQLGQWEKLFEEKGVKALLAIILVIQRVAEKRAPFTLRRAMRDGMPAKAMEWALAWEREMQREGFLTELLQAKPVAAPGVVVTARHVVRDGELVPEDFRVSVERPFEVEWKVQPWMPMLLPRCDGKTTVAELLEQSKENGWILPETPAEEFCGLIGNLISGTFLRVESF